MSIINEVKVYDPSGKLQKVISQKALYKRSDKLFKDPYLVLKKGRPKGQPVGRPKGQPVGRPKGWS